MSIAHSLRLALIGLTVALAAVAAIGVSSLYRSRQDYEDALAQSSALATAAASLATAGVAEEGVLRDARGPADAVIRRQAAVAFAGAVGEVARLARDDRESARLVADQLSAENTARSLAARNRHELTGEWVVSKPIDADELRHVLNAAVAAGRSRVLVVGRKEMQPVLERSLDELGCSSTWTCRGATGSTPVGSCARAPAPAARRS